MADAARRVDVIDTRPTWTADDVARLEAETADMDADALLAHLLRGELKGRVAAVSSFGTESAVLLDLVARADPTTPVLFVDTLKMFPETLAYRDLLAARLDLADVRSLTPDADVLAARDAAGERWSYDPDGCCAIRKVAPLAAGLEGFDAWISGRKGFQAATRANLPRFEIEDGRLKINPLSGWTKDDLDAGFVVRDLPRHPLEAAGYLSIGCAPCTTPVQPGEDPRAGRWRGVGKVECGIHGVAGGDVTPLPIRHG